MSSSSLPNPARKIYLLPALPGESMTETLLRSHGLRFADEPPTARGMRRLEIVGPIDPASVVEMPLDDATPDQA